MNNIEAIEWIENIKEKYIRGGDEEFDEKRKTALDMAKEALEQEPFEDDNEDCDYGYDENNAYDSYRDRYYDREYAERGE